ncbi:hypothetical protein AKJ09_10555 [Labilithrix luteola]|uniref:Uncharacterized protein n=1 Tax=Labilithrix luteola TaxID=1391654 RepID=A0A0K1QE07_9BACT|nr:hypothetical protein AKJ09_10555 [Labilithrix luteola]
MWRLRRKGRVLPRTAGPFDRRPDIRSVGDCRPHRPHRAPCPREERSLCDGPDPGDTPLPVLKSPFRRNV